MFYFYSANITIYHQIDEMYFVKLHTEHGILESDHQTIIVNH